MSPSELLRELAYPASNRTVLMAMLVFFLLAQLAAAAGMFGIWLLIVILPAYFRYLIALLETRLHGRRSEPPGIEMFNWIAGLWTFMPLIVLVGMGWGLLEVDTNFLEFFREDTRLRQDVELIQERFLPLRDAARAAEDQEQHRR